MTSQVMYPSEMLPDMLFDDDAACERFTVALLTQEQFARVCNAIREWSHTSEKVLNLVQPFIVNNMDVSHSRPKSLVTSK